MSTDCASPDSDTGVCDRCRATVSTALLGHASMPPLVAMAAAGNSEVDEPEPMPLAAFLDRRTYCPACRWRVNVQRALGSTLVVAALAAAVYFVVR